MIILIWSTALPKEISIAYAVDVLVTRTKNEWKLFMLPEFMRNVYREIMKKGEAYGVQNVGHYALESLRVEQGIPSWGTELDYSVSPVEAGLESLVDLEKEEDFIVDRDFLRDVPRKRLVHLTLCSYDDDNFPWGGEPVLYDDAIVGMTTSASFGFQENKPVAMAYVDSSYNFDNKMNNFKLEIAKRIYPVDIRLVRI